MAIVDILIENFVKSFLNEDKRSALLRMGYTKELADLIHSEFQPYSNKYGDWIGKQFIKNDLVENPNPEIGIGALLIALKKDTTKSPEDYLEIKKFVNKWVSKEILQYKNRIIEILEWATKRSGGMRLESYTFSELEKMMRKFKDQEEYSKVKKSFEDGWKWVDLQGSNCREEAEDMGHCGNDDRGDLWSLRDPNAKAHITLTMTKGGEIVQMKGSGNSKPNKKYFKYIAALLADPSLVKSVKQNKRYDGDIDENDFAFSDLGQNGMKWVLEKNPNLYYDNKPIDLEEGLDNIIAYAEKVIKNTFIEDDGWMNVTGGIKKFSLEKIEPEELDKIYLEGKLIFNSNYDQEEMFNSETFDDFASKRNSIKNEIESTFQHIKIEIRNNFPNNPFINYIPFLIIIKVRR